MSATVNGLRALTVRLVMPYQGVWLADIDLDPDVVQAVPPAGPAVITIGAPPVATLAGTIDPLFSGSFVASAKLRVLGGGGGWSRPVPSQDFANPAGVLSPVVIPATGALVGEVVTVLVPKLLATAKYERSAGPARRVLDDSPWWVDPTTGVTFVGGPRPPAVPDPSLEVISWDPDTKVAELTCDALVLPGTPIVSTKIGESPVIVRDVEQVFQGSGSRVTAWCSTGAVSRLQVALTSMVRELARTAYLKVYPYTVVGPAAGDTTGQKWLLQAVGRDPLTQAATPMPDQVPCTAYAGTSGASAKLTPGIQVLVHFVNGNPADPVMLGCSMLVLPSELTLDAIAAVHVGKTALAVDLAGGGAGVARIGDTIDFSELIVTAPSGGGPCTVAGVLKIATGSMKVTSG